MARIIVLGAGIGGMTTAYALRAELPAGHVVTVVGEGPQFSFTPSNPWVGVGWRERRNVVLDVEPHLARKRIDFVGEPATEIRAAQNLLITRSGRELPYDYLVICTGPKLAFDEVTGLGPGRHSHSICTIDHAEALWGAYQAFVEDPGPVVVGGAPGTSCFGPAYEFAAIVDTDLRRRRIRDRVPMTYVTPEPYLGHMGLGGVGDSKGLLETEFRRRHIKWICNARVVEVGEQEVRVEEMDSRGAVVQEHRLPAALKMIMPAFKGVEAVAAVEGLCNPRGFVLIDQHQRSPKYPNIFSAGVCVAIPPVEPTPVPTGAPKTGYMIESMVTAIVHNLKAELAGGRGEEVATWNAICLADMGDTGAAFVALPQIPPRNVTWVKIGKWVHMAKIAYEKYFMKKMRNGNTDPIYEKYMLKALGIERLKSTPRP